MSVWFAIPSKRPQAEAGPVLQRWQEQGYRIALFRDFNDPVDALPFNAIQQATYLGYAEAVNSLVRLVMHCDPDAEWIVTGGDDIKPDPIHRAETIARQCTEHFKGTFGVMQPTGDPFADYCCRRVCGSPWMGREFCQRMYGGKGPLWHEYFHMFVDEELQEVAMKLGVLWQRDDLVQRHNHWMREDDRMMANKPAPAFLQMANSRAHWDVSKYLFQTRQAKGFPGHEPLPA